MKESWKDYFSDIKLPEKLAEIIEKKSSEVERLCCVELEDVFVSTFKKEEKVEYASVWFFSKEQKVIECKNFVTDDDYDLVCLHKNVAYYNIIKKDMEDIDNPTDKSSVILNCNLRGSSLSCDFMAEGINCKYLISIACKYYANNVAEEA